jgi:hypothetical protein
MTISEAVYQWRTFVPVVFERAVTGAPTFDAPDVDDRSFKGPEHGPVVGMMSGQTVRVALRRVAVDNSAPLYLTSSSTDVAVEGLTGGLLPTGERVIFHLRAAAATPDTQSIRTARIQVRHGSTGGPILGTLTAWNCKGKRVAVTPHLVTINGPGGTSRGTDAAPHITDIFNMAQAIWRPCGIVFSISSTRTDTVTFAGAGEVLEGELNRLVHTNFVANSINAYFIHMIRHAPIPGLLGLGVNRARMSEIGVTNPAIILADTNLNGDVRDVQYWANDVAHEIGHYLSLRHAGDRNSEDRLQHPWARRQLMFPLNTQDRVAAPLAYRSNVGYGSLAGYHHRGCLITMKNVASGLHDGECGLARSTADTPSAIY